MTRPIARVVLAIFAVAAAGAACGIPNDRQPTILPGGVVEPVMAPTSPPAAPAPRSGPVPIYLAQAEHLVKVERAADHPDLAGVLRLLLAGPTEAEFASGLRSAISPLTTLRSVHTEGDTAVVDLGSSFVEVKGQEQILAVAQLVLTATAVPGVAQVRFLLQGNPVEIPGADGTLGSVPRRAPDYAPLLG